MILPVNTKLQYYNSIWNGFGYLVFHDNRIDKCVFVVLLFVCVMENKHVVL